jgi:DNA-binding response OmpR family regulator
MVTGQEWLEGRVGSISIRALLESPLPAETHAMNSGLQQGRQPTILVVEDDELIRDAITRILVREGYLAVTAATGHDAIGLLRTPSFPIDLVILDIGLPDVSGADLCARLREFFPRMPVVVCTGAASSEEVADLRRLGITHFFCKPISIEELVGVLRAALPISPA